MKITPHPTVVKWDEALFSLFVII